MDKNYLKNLAKKNKKHNKGMSFFTNTNAGNVELNQAMFNHAMDINGDFVSPDGGNCVMSESLDADTLGEIQSAASRVDGVELTIKNNGSDDDYFLIVDSSDDLNNLIMELGLTDENELSDMVDWGFSDEWTTCDHCGRAIHTQADSAFWKPDFWADYDYGEMLCGDCVREDDPTKKNYLDFLTNNPSHANTILSDKELRDAGYDKLNTEDYANGWYGKKDDPKEILKNALDESHDGEFIFSISSQNPFETSFDLWAKKGTYRNHVDVEAERDIDAHEAEFGADGLRAFGARGFWNTKSNDDYINEDEQSDYKKVKKNRAWKEYKTYDGKKIDRVISSTLPKDGNEKDVPIAKLFFGKAPDSVVLKGDEAEKYADNWQKMYPDDTDKYKEYADNQGRYISIHEGSEEK